MVIVAVAGGTGQLGRAIVEELINHGGHKVLILGREVSHCNVELNLQATYDTGK